MLPAGSPGLLLSSLLSDVLLPKRMPSPPLLLQ
jgi:hypothetical protein